MYIDTSNSKEYPKTLIIRNTAGGMIWQVYHVEKEIEASRLSKNARSNGFFRITLEDYQPEHEETFIGWRDSLGGKEIIKEDSEIYNISNRKESS